MLSAICEAILGWLYGRDGLAFCPLYARIYLGGFLAEVGVLSAIYEAILGWLYGRGGHAFCPLYARIH